MTHNQENPYRQQPQTPQEQKPEPSGRAEATFRITAFLAVLALLVVLMGNSSEQGIAMLAFIGFAIVSAASYFAARKQ